MSVREISERTTVPGVRRIARARLLVLLLLIVLIAVVNVGQLVSLQIIQHERLAGLAAAEINGPVEIAARRGRITDSHGNLLALDVERESLFAIPPQIDGAQAPLYAAQIAAVTGQKLETVLEALTRPDAQWVTVARWLTPEAAAAIDALEIRGLRLIYEPLRLYPQGESAAQIVGAVNYNGQGISGIESYYDNFLRGEDGAIDGEFDPIGNPIAIEPLVTQEARNGADLQLTIDPYIQQLAEAELKTVIAAQQADGGSIVIMDPRSGAVKAMVSWPLFDPNRWQSYPPEVYGRNPAVGTLYEPGSTFKMFTAAAGLDSGGFSADTIVDDPGAVIRYGTALRNFDAKPRGALNVGGMLYYSSNVAALQLNEMTGPDRFYAYVARFGFGQPTGIDLGGEEAGIVNFVGGPNYNDINFLTNSYGQGISVTPLQLVQAASAIANDGIMMRPYVVQQICDSEGCRTTQPREAGRPINPATAASVRDMLVEAANHYAPVIWGPRTGNYDDQWLVPGYRVGAKTGTASIPLPGGGYDQQYTIGSVLGIAPVDDPRFVLLVKVDRPKIDTLGVLTAVPVFYNLVEQLMRYERMPPDRSLVSDGQP
jgi:cell division protein FtsI (penicillin-binding protein 3)